MNFFQHKIHTDKMKKIDFVDCTCIIQFFLKVSLMYNSFENEVFPSVSINFGYFINTKFMLFLQEKYT